MKTWLSLHVLNLSLRWRINIAILLSVIVIISLGLIFSVLNAHAKTQSMVRLSLELARQSIEDGMKSQEYNNALFWQNQFGLSAGTQNLRIRLILPTGKAIQYRGDWQNNANTLIPEWFQKLVTPGVMTHNKVIATDIGNIRAVIHSDPSVEIIRSWETAKALFWLILLQALLVSMLMHFVITRAFLSVPKIIEGLSLLEKKQFNNRLPVMNVPEFTHITEAINHTASALEMISKENRELITQSLKIQEEERQTLARELHDELGQSLIAIKMMASSIESNDKVIVNARDSIISICDHVFTEIRSMMRKLRPTVLDELGLVAAIQDMTTVWNNQNKIDTFLLDVNESVEDCCSSVKIHIYRMIQEALNNISKHSGADSVEITLQMSADKEDTQDEKQGSWIRLQIKDNGCGFDDSEDPLGFGLMGLRERVAILNGAFELNTQLDKGVSITILIPCEDL